MLGVVAPSVHIDPESEGIDGIVGDQTMIIVGKRAASMPFAPVIRDQLGRSLFRLAFGGDFVCNQLDDGQLLGLLSAACQAAGLEPLRHAGVDQDYAQRVLPLLRNDAGLVGPATAFHASLETFDVPTLRMSMQYAEDRAAVLCAADPRATLQMLVREDDGLCSDRATSLLGFLVSDAHLTVRRAVGYPSEIELLSEDIEEESA